MGDEITYPKKVLCVGLRISDKRSFSLREFKSLMYLKIRHCKVFFTLKYSGKHVKCKKVLENKIMVVMYVG